MRFIALPLLACGALLATFPAAAAPPPGTPIDNQATATFLGTPTPVASNTVRTIVAAREGVDLVDDRVTTADPGDTVSFAHVLTNTGTADALYTLLFSNVAGDDFDFASLLLFVDANGNGVRDAGETTLMNGAAQAVAAGASLALVLQGVVPSTAVSGQIGRATLTATGADPAVTDTNTDAVTIAAPPSPPAIGFFTDGSFAAQQTASPVGDPLFVEGSAASCNADPFAVDSTSIRLATLRSGDDETFPAVETGPDTGVFRIVPSVPTASELAQPVVAGDGTLQTRDGDTVTATLADCGSGATVAAQLAMTAGGPAPSSVLLIQKDATQDYVEIGEWVEYQVAVNNAGTAPLQGAVLEDTLPGGFRYERGSSRIDGRRADDPDGGVGPTIRYALGTLLPDQIVTVTYRVLVGPGSRKHGYATNRAQAFAGNLRSNVASARVRIDDGVFTDRGYVIGKVFADCNGDREQDPGEPGVPGVQLFLEDGTSVITDVAGKYSFYGVSPRTHSLKLDPASLPAGARLRPLGNRFARDAGSQFIDLKHGELHRGDFALDACTEPLLEAIRLREEAALAQEDELDAASDRELLRDDPQEVTRDVRALPASGVVSRGPTQTFGSPLPIDDGLNSRNSNRPPRPIAPAPSVRLEEQLAALTPELGFVDLTDGAILPGDQVSVRVKGRAGTQLDLWVNGERVSQNRVGQRSSSPSTGAQAWEYVGVRFARGENQLELREMDGFGNARGSVSIRVVAPGELARMRIELPDGDLHADGRTATPVTVFVEDRGGIPVTARTPVTLGTSDGVLQGDDLDPVEPGLQVFAEGGRTQAVLIAPGDPGEVELRAVSGLIEADRTVRFFPYLRPLVGAGVFDAVIDWSKLKRGDLVPEQQNDTFQEEIKDILVGEDGKTRAGVRSALFLKGKIKGETLLTLRYDTEQDRYRTLFRDIEPDRFYPVYGDSGTRGFDAQSMSRLYVRIDKGPSYVLWGDYVTQENDDAVMLGAYRRGLTGARGHYETGRVEVDAFAAHDDSTQIIEEIRGRGVAGPYDLRYGDVLENSELVEILVRDRDQPSIVIEARPLTRFLDYELDSLAGTLLLRQPVPSFDARLNPVSIRINYEVDTGGDEYWAAGAAAAVRPLENVEIGANYVSDRNPAVPLDLVSGHLAWDIDERTRAVAEVAHSNDDFEKGFAGRVDVRHQGERLDAWAYWVKSNTDFNNPNSLFLNGRMEIGAKSSYALTDATRLVGHAIWTEDEEDDGVRRGVEAYVDQAIGRWLRGEFGLRYVNETSAPASLDTAIDPSISPYQYVSARARLSAPIPWWPRLSVFGEYEQAVTDLDKRVLAAGGEFQVWNRTRLYARHEFISSLGGAFTLNSEQDRNVTLFGIESDVLRNTSAFSEYRVSDVIGARDAEAAIGLRNRWTVAQGLTLNTAFERIQSVTGDDLGDDDSLAASVGVAYTRSPLWKATGRVEYRLGETQNSFLSTFGVAAKIDENWSFLGRNLLYLNGIQQSYEGGDDVVQRFQLGLAYRPTETNRWNALGRYELKYVDDSEEDTDDRRLVHVVSTHLDYQMSPRLRSNGRYAIKYGQQLAGDPDQAAFGQLLAGRLTYDVTDRWDVGVIGSAYATGALKAVDYGLGAEVGYLVAKNVWATVGYNFFGFEDDDLTDGDYTNPGVYFRLRVKFDEDMFRWLQP